MPVAFVPCGPMLNMPASLQPMCIIPSEAHASCSLSIRMRPQLATSDTFVEKLWVCWRMGVKGCAGVQMRWRVHVCKYMDTCKSGQLHPRPSRSSLPTGDITLDDAFATFLKPSKTYLNLSKLCFAPGHGLLCDIFFMVHMPKCSANGAAAPAEYIMSCSGVARQLVCTLTSGALGRAR